jgi:hypothetical protein
MMESKYFGLIEVVATALIFGVWFLWDRRNLKRDMEAREERERAARKQEPPI